MSASINIKSSKSFEKNLQSKKRNVSLSCNTFKNNLYKSPSKSISDLYYINTFQSGLPVKRNKTKRLRVTSMIQFREEEKKKPLKKNRYYFIKK